VDGPAGLGTGGVSLLSGSGRTVMARFPFYLLPVFAIILGVTVLSETITLAIAGEITLILAGVTLTRRHQQAKQPADQHP
jgi:drug/metabolite transporter (DMT)-like permease